MVNTGEMPEEPVHDDARPLASPSGEAGAPPDAGEAKPDPPAAAGDPTQLAPSADATSSMTPRFNLFFRWFSRRFFGHFDLDADQVARLRALEEQGAVVYVMRYSSRLDYLLFN